jgi:hypothetical protein
MFGITEMFVGTNFFLFPVAHPKTKELCIAQEKKWFRLKQGNKFQAIATCMTLMNCQVFGGCGWNTAGELHDLRDSELRIVVLARANSGHFNVAGRIYEQLRQALGRCQRLR